MPEWLPYLITTAAGIFFGAAAWLVKIAWPMVHKTAHLIDDIAGEKERPGVDARPGLMERIANLEDQVATIHDETTPNHGGSIKDEMRRIEYRGIQTAKTLTEHVEQTDKWTQMLTDLHDTWSKKNRRPPTE